MEEIKEVQIEWSIVQCKHCGETKKRVMDGRYPNKKDQRWVNPETGKQWSGKVCAECVVEKARQRKRLKRLNQQVASNG